MKKLTREILKEEADRYFLKRKAQFDIGIPYDTTHVGTNVLVFPGYQEWLKERGNKIAYVDGAKLTGWAMQNYISKAIGLAYHLIENDYPTKGILALLPRDFSSKVAERLK